MNIPIVNVVGQDENDTDAKRDFTIYLGAISSMLEHIVPERLLRQVAEPAGGISAAKAIVQAGNNGQRVYLVTPANQGAVLGSIHHDAATMSDIPAALAAGRTVLTHTDSVAVPGWTGAGYVVVDPITGASAWKISGGQNGGVLRFIIGTFLIVAMFGLFTGPAWVVVFASMYGVILEAALLMDRLDCDATGAILIGVAISTVLAHFPLGDRFFNAQKFIAWLMDFIYTGAVSTSPAACRRVIG